MTAPAPRPSRPREMRRGADMRSVGTVVVCLDCYCAGRWCCALCAGEGVL